MEGKRFYLIILVALVVLLGYLSYRILEPFLVPIAWAIVLAILFYPLYGAVRRLLPWDSLASLLVVGIALIAVIGPLIIWAPATLCLYFQGAAGKALLLAVIGAGGISAVDYFLRPMTIGKRTRMPFLFIFFSVLGGIQFFGLLGFVMGPMVLALFISVIEIFRTPGRGIIPETLRERKRLTPAAAAPRIFGGGKLWGEQKNYQGKAGLGKGRKAWNGMFIGRN